MDHYGSLLFQGPFFGFFLHKNIMFSSDVCQCCRSVIYPDGLKTSCVPNVHPLSDGDILGLMLIPNSSDLKLGFTAGLP